MSCTAPKKMEAREMITFVSGGARSGKSSLAEEWALNEFSARNASGLFYIATSTYQTGTEMNERIRMHQQNRASHWVTIEEPFNHSKAIRDIPCKAVVLIDCLTVWVSNLLFAEHSSEKIQLELRQVFEWVKEKEMSLYLVSNDVNEGVPIKNDLVDRYIRELEKVHSYSILHSSTVVEVMGGFLFYWKRNGVYHHDVMNTI